MIETKTIKALPSSFVALNMKLATDKGSGEAKLWVGQTSNMSELDSYFAFDNNYSYSFSRGNLIDYLNQVKFEYAYQKFNSYKNVSINTWEEKYNEINSMSDDEFVIHLYKYTDESRYYIRSDEDVFRKLFRSIAVPKLTNVVFVKDTENKTIQLRLELNLDYVNGDVIGKNNGDSFPKAKGGLNKIYYGAPGCGKSYFVKKTLDEIGAASKNRIRVTFHPEYSNSDFVGQILPSIEEKYDEETGEKQEIVKYSFHPGPFTLALLQSYKTNEMVYLIIEEINRGNAAAIFGDLFQLLDREKDETKENFSESEYPIDNPSIQNYLSDTLYEEGIEYDGKLVIPSNLTIFATMNSSDQNVFTMDTAFKRRWAFEQISNDIYADNNHSYKNWFIPGTAVTWAVFLTKINDRILENKIYNQTNEDKRMGKYFVTRECLTETADSNNPDAANNFAYKVLEYLWNDVCKIGRENWFDTAHYRTLEELIDGFINPAANSTPLAIFQNIVFDD